MEIEEVKVYKARLENEYEDLLKIRQGILIQTELDKEEAEIAKRNKDVILMENLELMQEAVKALDDIKKEKEVFVNSLNVREADILNKQKLIQEISDDLKIKAEEVETAKEDYKYLVGVTKDEQKMLKEEIKKAEYNQKAYNHLEDQAKLVLKINQKDSEEIESEKKVLSVAISVFQKEKKHLELEKEAVQMQREQIEVEKEFIKIDRKHLDSQQQAMKYAYEEAHRQLAEARKLCQPK